MKYWGELESDRRLGQRMRGYRHVASFWEVGKPVEGNKQNSGKL